MFEGSVDAWVGLYGARISYFDRPHTNPHSDTYPPIRGYVYHLHGDEIRESGWWMDWPETSWGIDLDTYYNMPVHLRALLEAGEQAVHWSEREWNDPLV